MTALPPPPPGLIDGASLFLDFDGTLVEFAGAPDGIHVAASLRDELEKLRDRLDGRLAVISGRGLDELGDYLGIAAIGLAGSHGLERRLPDGRCFPAEAPPGLDALIGEARAFAAPRDLIVEPKPAGVALHYRGAPEHEAAVDRFAHELAQAHGLLVQRGAMVRELRPPGWDKGEVLRAFMAEPPFALGRPVMVGDDLTDEHAFAAANALGGASVLVGPERVTAAAYRLASVGAVRDWIKGDD